MRRFPLAVALLAGCTPATPWAEVAVVDARATPDDNLVAWVHSRIQTFGADTTVDAVPLDEVRLVDAIPVEDPLENVDDDSGGAAGIYRHEVRTIEIASPDAGLGAVLDHELCHAVDGQLEFSANNEEWLTLDALPSDVRARTAFPEGGEAAEVFARLCQDGPAPWLEAALQRTCDAPIIDEPRMRVVEATFLEDVVLAGTVDLTVDWRPLPFGDESALLEARPVDGRLIAMLADGDVVSIRADGSVPTLAELSWRDLSWAHVVPSDGPVVILGGGGHPTLRVKPDAIETLALPERTWTTAVIDDGVLLAGAADDGPMTLVAVDLATGDVTEIAPPMHVFELLSRGGVAVLRAGDEAFAWNGAGWEPTFELDSPEWLAQRATLADGRQLARWNLEVYGEQTSGFVLRDPDGALSFPADVCAFELRPSGDLVTDGTSAWIVREDKIATIDLGDTTARRARATP